VQKTKGGLSNRMDGVLGAPPRAYPKRNKNRRPLRGPRRFENIDEKKRKNAEDGQRGPGGSSETEKSGEGTMGSEN